VHTESGSTEEKFDIRYPIGVSIEYEVLQPGYVLMPSFTLVDEEDNLACVALDQDKNWRGRMRPPGKYVSTGWIPGNMLGEGLLAVNTAMWALKPEKKLQYFTREAVAFRVFDKMEGDSAKGDFRGGIDGSIRPIFKWDTNFDSADILKYK
jgi:lipopolysaccharide transport system ATP-binding protein